MINNRRVIAVCITKMQSTGRADFLNRLHYRALKQWYKLIIYNSFVDFYRNDAFDEGARAVYDLIDYDIVDAVVIHDESFHDKTLTDRIISGAAERNVPVILLNSEKDGCITVVGDYDEAYKNVIDHVIKEHGVTDTFFIAGNENDPISDRRLRCYKKALEENGLVFDENKVAYGNYWEVPTQEIIRSLVADGKKPPEAIICANDYMAIAACEELGEYGYRVPEDVIVTGFDGVPAATYFTPAITTCKENVESVARVTIAAVDAALSGSKEKVFRTEFSPLIAESCGCHKFTNIDYRAVASVIYHDYDEMCLHEDFMFSQIDHALEIHDMNSLYVAVAGSMMEDSYVCLKNDFVAFAMGTVQDMNSAGRDDEYIVIPSKYSGGAEKITSMPGSQLLPTQEEWANNDHSYILNTIHVGSEVCGYYAVSTDHIMGCRNKIKRVLKTINVGFNIVINYFKQANMRLSIEKASRVNPVTGLPNLKGAVKWFKEFSAVEENHSKAISISVYGLPKYTYIFENYGIANMEEALRLVAETLKLANTNNCLVGHIAEDEFVVINYYDDPMDIGPTIENATAVFYSVIESYNKESGKPYFIEVNCGCTVASTGWTGELEGFIKFANSEMYMNRLKSGMGSAVKQETAPKAHYKAFNLLIEKNLFSYHFQPIVSAKNGDIYGYEALMRTDSSIGMNPLEVLDAAKEYNRLYDIEKATMFNVLERFSVEKEKFGNAKVFINTIPGHFLNSEDTELLKKKYGAYMDNCVFELTEQDVVADEELEAIRRLSADNSTSHVAIDDYGAGHSNIVNLMRYAPKIIKIDRFLVTDIHKNQNKQLFVRSTVEFARINNIMVLAEGVETSNELHTVIDLGVDLIQGYYTGKPAPEPVPAINTEIKQEIVQANPLYY